MPDDDALCAFLALCAAPDLARLQLTQPPEAGGAQRVHLRPVQLRGEAFWQAVWKHPTKDLTENWPAAEGPDRVAALLAQGWRSAALWSTSGHWQLDQARKGGWKLVRHKGQTSPAEPAQPDHDRIKRRALDLSHPVWAALGLADAMGRPVPAMARKWKQINHFVALFERGLEAAGLPDATQATAPLRVADFGCGRAYLTFALALYLAQRGIPSEVVGVELRDELVAQTETLARELGLVNLRFEQGDVGHQQVKPLDVMIALHACDVATDVALHHGCRAGARLMLCAPCCHKQLRGQMQPPSMLRPLFRHGIHLGQEAEMLTDGLRALLLESRGYDAQVFEFVSLEHTQKNKMIQAVRRVRVDAARDARAAREVAELKEFWKIREQQLETLLMGSN